MKNKKIQEKWIILFLIISLKPFEFQRCTVPHFKAIDLLFWPLALLLTLGSIVLRYDVKCLSTFFCSPSRGGVNMNQKHHLLSWWLLLNFMVWQGKFNWFLHKNEHAHRIFWFIWRKLIWGQLKRLFSVFKVNNWGQKSTKSSIKWFLYLNVKLEKRLLETISLVFFWFIKCNISYPRQ